MFFLQRRRLGEAVGTFLVSRKAEGCAAKTVLFYRERLNWLLKCVPPDTALRSIKSDTLLKVQASLQGIHLSDVTVHDTMNAVRIFFRWCLRQEYISEDPASKIKKLKLPKRFPKFAPPPDVEKLLKGCNENRFEGLRDYVMIQFLFDTGLRRGEVNGLTLASIDFEKLSVIVLAGKGDKDRVVYFGDKMQGLLQQWLEKRGNHPGPLFCSRNGKALKGRNTLAIFERLEKRLTMDAGLGPHRIRHTAATALAAKGMNTFALSQFLGHAHTRTTEVYMHLSGNMLQEAYRHCSPVDNYLKNA